METMTALSTLSVLPSNKEEVKRFSRMLKDEILAADRDPLKILVQLKLIEKVLEDVLKDEEIDHHFNKEFELYGKEKVLEINLNDAEKAEFAKSADAVRKTNDVLKEINAL